MCSETYMETDGKETAGLPLPGGRRLVLPSYVMTALTTLENAGFEACAVGGCIRDSMLGLVPHDYDVCTNACPEEMERVFSGFRTIGTGLKHGTLTVLIEDAPVEITVYRVDGEYTDHRRPDRISFTGSLEEDLKRRDFTVNAMAYSLKKGFTEAEGGAADLASGLIRCVGDPDKRFQEDALRILRAMRFAARYGFTIEADTLRAMKKNKALLAFVSKERIFSELCGFLEAKDGEAVSRILEDCREIIMEILPELAPCVGLDQQNPHHCYDVWTHTRKAVAVSEPDLILRFALLLHDIGKPHCKTVGEDGRGHFHGHDHVGCELAESILSRLKAPKKFTKEVCLLVEWHEQRRHPSMKSAGKILSACGEELTAVLFQMMRCDTLAQSDYRREQKLAALEELERYASCYLAERRCLHIGDLAITGNDIMALGCPPGKQVGNVLNFLLESVMEEKTENENAALCKAAAEYIKDKMTFQEV